MRNKRTLVLLNIVMGLAACAGSPPEGAADARTTDVPDASAVDSGSGLPDGRLATPDASSTPDSRSSVDAAPGSPDAARPDAALPDAPLPDAPLPDAAAPDAARPDAALPDAALPDAAPPDAASGGLPPLHVENNVIKDSTGRTIILRGVSMVDLGTLYAWSEPKLTTAAITNRIDKILSVGVKPRVIRLPVYPRTNVNQNWPYYSPAPFPVGPPVPSGKVDFTPLEMTPEEYYSKLLKPTVDYVTAMGMYVIIDYHQIDDATPSSIGDAKTFWQFVAPKFKDSPNVIYEAFNEPINVSRPNNAERWAEFKPYAQQLVDTIRAGAPNNIILLGSPSWCQMPGAAAASPVNGTNITLTAHIYPLNWNQGFNAEITSAVAKFPVIISEWGYGLDDPNDKVGYANSPNWGPELRTFINNSRASWTAWVTDDIWTPKMFRSVKDGTLTEFGALVRDWLNADLNKDWIR